jgi:AcrR family transcriptional regulator
MPQSRKVQPRKKPKQQRATERVELIINSYLELLDQGETRITTNSIARAAGIPVSSLYQYFPNKEAIACAVYSHWAEQGIAVLEKRREQARAVANWQDYFDKGRPDFFGQILGAKVVHQLAPVMNSTPELREVQRSYLKKMIAILSETVRILGSDWPDKPLDNMVSLIIELNTTVFHHMARQNRTDAGETHAHWQEAATRLLERCILTPYDQLREQEQPNKGFNKIGNGE